MLPRLSLRVKLLASFILILLPVLGLLIYGYNQANERRLDTLLDTQMQTAQAVASVVDASFDEAMTLGRSLANDPVVRTLDSSQVDPHLQQLVPNLSQFVAIGVLNAAGDNVGTTTAFPPGSQRLRLGADRPYFQQVMATGKPVISTVLISRVPPPAVSVAVAVPIRDEAGNTVGAVVVGPRLEALSRRLEGIALGPEQNILLVDTSGTAAFHTALPDLPWEERNLSDFEPVRAATEGTPTGVRRFVSPLLGDTRIGAFVPSPKYGWVVGVSVREDVALAPVRDALRDQLLGLGTVAILSFGLILLLSSRLLQPIRRLTAHALALGRGDMDQQVQIRTGDEIEDLGRTFNQMADEIGARTAERERLLRQVELLAGVAQQRAAELQGVLDNMVDGVFVCNTEERITLANGAGVRLLGMDSLEEVEVDLRALLERVQLRHLGGQPVDPKEMPLVRALMGETVVQEDEIIYNPRTERDVYIRSTAAPIRDEKGETRGAVAVTRDVTESMELERLKDQFLSVAAHELKTPVTGIRGYAQLLLRWEHEGISPRGLKALEAINRQTARISRLVNELLETSRIQTGRLELHPTRFDLSQLAAETVERMKIATEKHRLLFQSPEPVLVNADRDRIGEVLNALLDNAIRFSPQGGDIETTVRTSQGGSVEEAVVSVQDHGVGIPKEKQARIFERFYRAHTGTPNDYGGMGIALFISKEIITRHGGRMWFESREPSGRGQGSTFYFSLPTE